MDMDVLDKALKAERTRLARAITDKMSTADSYDKNADEYREKMENNIEWARTARSEAGKLQKELKGVQEALMDLHDRQGRGSR